MTFVKGLFCRECGREYPAEATYVCEFCFGPLEVNYDYQQVANVISRERIEKGPLTIWRYRDLLPVETDTIVDLGAGYTPLIKADNLAREIGLNSLYLKNDTANPTHSFKDRVTSVAISKAKEFEYKIVACASTGNLANSVAAHAAKAGLEAYLFIPADLEAGKIVNSAVYQPNLIGVEGSYDDVNRLCSEVASVFDWAFVNVNIRPYYAEGSKTLGFETVEQLGWKAPDHVIVPVASGSLLTKIRKGIDELQKVGLIDHAHTKVSGAQAKGCSPIVTAFKNNTLDIRPVKPNTIAKSLAIGNPADGYYALKAVRESGGFLEDVTDEEIVEGIKLLARTEGIFAETAGGVSVSVLKKLVQQGKIDQEEQIVVYITGTGLKTIEAVQDRISPPIRIKPSMKSFRNIVLKESKTAV